MLFHSPNINTMLCSGLIWYQTHLFITKMMMFLTVKLFSRMKLSFWYSKREIVHQHVTVSVFSDKSSSSGAEGSCWGLKKQLWRGNIYIINTHISDNYSRVAGLDKVTLDWSKYLSKDLEALAPAMVKATLLSGIGESWCSSPVKII